MTTPLAIIPKPVPRLSMNVRAATAADVPFIDQLQKAHRHMVGWMPVKQLEKYISDGNALIAEEMSVPRPSGSGQDVSDPQRGPLPHGRGTDVSPLGYVIAKDQYKKRPRCAGAYFVRERPGCERPSVLTDASRLRY